MTKKLRWKIAHLLNRLPRQCWTDLVMWATRSRFQRWPWAPQNSSCRQDAVQCGACYCGKLRAQTGAES